MVDLTSNLSNNRFIITGGPGSGKTTLVEALKAGGFTGFPEIARELIGQGISPPIQANKPDMGRFFGFILQQRVFYHQQIKGAEIGFYDRGIPDSLAYFKFQERKVPDILSEAIELYRYNLTVFAAPPWEEIYHNDSIRMETFSEARTLYQITVEAYLGSGYQIVELPEAPVEERFAMVSSYARFGR